MRTWTHLTLAMTSLVAMTQLSGCLMATGIGQMENPALVSPLSEETADISLERQHFTLGTIFDFRAARLLVTLETLTLDPSLKFTGRALASPTATRQLALERRVFRVDAPVLSFWDFENKESFGYPGVMKHRNSLDLWLRGGLTNDGESHSLGGAVGWYEARFLGAYLAVDYWTEPTSVQGLDGPIISTYAGNTSGWVVSLEVNLAAGEYALDAIDWLWAMDKKVRAKRRR